MQGYEAHALLKYYLGWFTVERERERVIERDLGGAATVDSDQVCLLYVLI